MPNKTFTQYRVDNFVTVRPTTLAHGQEVYYKDANGNVNLWVGLEDGTAFPACGYKEWVGSITPQSGVEGLTVIKNDFDVTFTVLTNGVVYTNENFTGLKFDATVSLGSIAPQSNSGQPTFFVPSNTSNDDDGDGVPIGSLPFSSWYYNTSTDVFELAVQRMRICIRLFP